MAEIIKEKHKVNETSQFKRFREYFRKQRDKYKQYIVIEYILSVFLVFYIVNYLHLENPSNNIIFYLSIFSLVLIFALMVQQQFNIEETRKLKSYEEYLKLKNEETKNMGDEGEWAFIDSLKETIEEDDYSVLNNICLPGEKDYLPQIDSIIIGLSGNLYVVEIKNWSGLTIGSISDKNWYSEYSQEYRNNPYQQNEMHKNKLLNILPPIAKDKKIYNLVINMAHNSLFNICKFEKAKYHIYNYPDKLFYLYCIFYFKIFFSFFDNFFNIRIF